jgi:hypothetical protein
MAKQDELTHVRKALQLLDRSISTAIMARDQLSQLCKEDEKEEEQGN